MKGLIWAALAMAGAIGVATGAEIRIVGDERYDVRRCAIRNLDAWRQAVDAEPGYVICATPVPRGLTRDSEAWRAARTVGEEVFKLADNKRVLYLDVRPYFCGKDGINPAYYEPDGLALNAAGRARLEQLYQPLRDWAASNSTNPPPATKYGYKGANTSRIHFQRSAKDGGARWWWDRVMEKLAQHDRICREDGGKLDVLFIGDSISHRWEYDDSGAPVYARLCKGRSVMNMAIGGDGRRSQRWLLDNGMIDGLQAKLVSICLGANDHNYRWSDDTPAAVARDIGSMVALVRRQMPDAKIVIVPINRRLTGKQEHAEWWKNDLQTNALLEKLADGRQVFFLDIGEPLRQAVGREAELAKVLTTDGTHLSRRMFEHWYELLEPYLPAPGPR
ncbi:MAG: GDSL-type esterase/lipase family protein [Kiritimatiellia bacterium]